MEQRLLCAVGMRLRRLSPLLPLCLLTACGSSATEPGGGPDGGAEPGEPDAGGDNQGTLPEVPRQAGVAYVVHFHDQTLRSYRLDGETPKAGPTVDLGAVSHDMDLDRENDLLAVASDVARQVTLLQLSRPAGPEEPLAEPTVAGRIPLDRRPVFVRLHPYRQRLYTVVSPSDGGPLEEMELHVHDISQPARAVPVGDSPYTIPVTVSLALDPVRDVLFLVDLQSDELRGYDLHGDRLEPLGGDPIDLAALYPEENQTSFQARNLTVDPYRNRLYAARAQSALSEVIAFEYPADIPRGAAGYGDFAGMADLARVDDAFEVAEPVDDRPNLLGGYSPAIDAESGDVFLSADAWNGSSASALVLGLDQDLSLGENCGAFEGFGCWIRSHLEGDPASHKRTDGALCVDTTHQVVLATSVAQGEEVDPGEVHLFRYQDDLSMSPWLGEDGGDLLAGGLPVAAACH